MKRERDQTPLSSSSCQVRVTSMRSTIIHPEDEKVLVVNCTSRSKETIWRELSPFYLGPLDLYDGMRAKRHENAWQYAKVYKKYTNDQGEPTPAYLEWAQQGWANNKAVRFPMGRGAKPEYSLWDGKKYGYVDARKKIYAPTYAALVVKTDAYTKLKDIVDSGEYSVVWLRDFDGYDNVKANRSYTQVLNDPKRKMGHGFVLAMCLTDNRVWEAPDQQPKPLEDNN